MNLQCNFKTVILYIQCFWHISSKTEFIIYFWLLLFDGMNLIGNITMP